MFNAYKCTITFPRAEVIDGSTWTVDAGVVVTYFKGKITEAEGGIHFYFVIYILF